MIRDFHAHIYFNPDEIEQAQALGHAARERFGVPEGHYHLGPVGPNKAHQCRLYEQRSEAGE